MKNKKGFTLIEMMVVVLILAGLAAIAYPTYTKVITKAKITEAFSLIEIVREAQQRSLAVDNRYFSAFTEAHTGGRTRLIKSGRIGISHGALIRDNYAVSISDVLETTDTKAVPNGCIIVKYYKTVPEGNLENSPVFIIRAHVEDSTLWCEDSVNNNICGVIPAGTLSTNKHDCKK